MMILQRLHLNYIICKAALQYFWTGATIFLDACYNILGSHAPNPEGSSGDVILDIQLMSKQVPDAKLVLSLTLFMQLV